MKLEGRQFEVWYAEAGRVGMVPQICHYGLTVADGPFATSFSGRPRHTFGTLDALAHFVVETYNTWRAHGLDRGRERETQARWDLVLRNDTGVGTLELKGEQHRTVPSEETYTLRRPLTPQEFATLVSKVRTSLTPLEAMAAEAKP